MRTTPGASDFFEDHEEAPASALQHDGPTRSRASVSQQSTDVIHGDQLYRDCLSASIRCASGDHVATFPNVAAWMERRVGGAPLVLICTSGLDKEREASELDSLLTQPDPPVLVVVVGDSEAPEHIMAVLNKGARGYIPTSLFLDIAVEALRLVRAGGVYFPVDPMLHTRREAAEQPVKSAPTLYNLTPKETAVTEMIRRGKPNKTIAYELNMCETTVKVHVRNIMKKLSARNRTHVAFLADQMAVEGVR
jgi:DNA-binding NarL/FixJ family response regulator